MSNPFAHTIAAITAEHLAQEQARRRVYDEALAAFAQFDEVITPARVNHTLSATDLDGALYALYLDDDRHTSHIGLVKWQPASGRWCYLYASADENKQCLTMRDCLQAAMSDKNFAYHLLRAQTYMLQKHERIARQQARTIVMHRRVAKALLCTMLVVAAVLSVMYGAEIPL